MIKNHNTYLFNLIIKSNNYAYLKNKTIFITGSTGFLGRWLLRLINFLNIKKKLNIQLYLLIRDKKKNKIINNILTKTNFNTVYGSVLNFKFINIKIDHIIHLASQTYDNDTNYLDIMKTTINGTERVIKFSEFIKVKSISYLSSGAVYGKNCIKKNGWKEDFKSSPLVNEKNSTYGLSKRCAENLLINHYYSHELKTLNIFRAFSFGGSDFNKNNNFAYDSFVKNRIKSNNIVINSNAKSVRNYMHPLDLCDWILRAFKFRKINIINTGGRDNLSLGHLAKIISCFNYANLEKVKVKHLNHDEKENYVPDCVKAKELGLDAKISINMQIEDSLNFYYNKIHD